MIIIIRTKNYYLKETKAPLGYELDEREKTVIVEFNKEATVQTKELIVSNKVKDSALKGGVRLLKTGLNGIVLKDAKFGLYDSNDKLIKEEVIDNNLPLGKYYFQEVKAPEGYKLDETLTPFEIKFNEEWTYTKDQIMQIIATNKKTKIFNPASVILKKKINLQLVRWNYLLLGDAHGNQ